MITTLPGLYLVSVGVIKPLVWLAGLRGGVVCSTAMLRFVNLLFNGGNLYLLYLLTCKLHLREKVGSGRGQCLLAVGGGLNSEVEMFQIPDLEYRPIRSTYRFLVTSNSTCSA